MDDLLSKNTIGNKKSFYDYEQSLHDEVKYSAQQIEILIHMLYREIEPFQVAALKSIIKGVAWFAGGLLVSLLTYRNSLSNGGVYFVFYGAIIFGGYQAIRSLIQFIKIKALIREAESELWSKVFSNKSSSNHTHEDSRLNSASNIESANKQKHEEKQDFKMNQEKNLSSSKSDHFSTNRSDVDEFPYKNNKKNYNESDSRKGLKKWLPITLLSIGVLLLIVLFFSGYLGPSEMRVNRLISQGRYTEARDVLFELDGTLSKSRLQSEIQFQEAIELYEKGSFEEAVWKFKDIQYYKTSDEYYDKSIKAIYNSGNDAFERENYSSAVDKYEFAANLGHVASMYMLGFCHENGYGFRASISNAERYYQEAWNNGNLSAREALDRLSQKENSKQIYSFKLSWSEESTKINGIITHPAIITPMIENCYGFTLTSKTSATKGNPFRSKFYTMIKKDDTEWESISSGYIQDDVEYSIDFKFEEPISFSQIDVLPVAKGLGESEWYTSIEISNVKY